MNNQLLCWAKTCEHQSSLICGPFIRLSLHPPLITLSLFLVVSSRPVSLLCFNFLIILYLLSASFHFLSFFSPSLGGHECHAWSSWQQRWEGKMEDSYLVWPPLWKKISNVKTSNDSLKKLIINNEINKRPYYHVHILVCNCFECSSAENTPKDKNRSCKSLESIRGKPKILKNTIKRCSVFVYQNVHVLLPAYLSACLTCAVLKKGGRLLGKTEHKMWLICVCFDALSSTGAHIRVMPQCVTESCKCAVTTILVSHQSQSAATEYKSAVKTHFCSGEPFRKSFCFCTKPYLLSHLALSSPPSDMYLVSPELNKSTHWSFTAVCEILHLYSTWIPTSLLIPLPSLCPARHVQAPAAGFPSKGRSIILRQRAPLPRAFILHYWQQWCNGGFRCWLRCDVWIQFRNKCQEIVKI